MPAGFKGFHDLQPLLQVTGKTGTGGGFQRLAGTRTEHHHGTTRRPAPALLRCTDQYVNASGLHIHPHGARGNAVQHHQPANGMHRIAHCTQVVIGQHHACSGFNVRCEHNIGALCLDGGNHFLHWAGHPRCLWMAAEGVRLEHGGRTGNAPHVKDLRPAITEPAVAQDQRLLVGCKLPRHRFHAECSASRHQHCAVGVVDLFQNG